MENIYFDTSVIVKLYVLEDGSEEIFNVVKKNKKPLLLNQLQETELKNAFSLKAFRKEISSIQLSALTTKFQRDITIGRFVRQKVDWNSIWELAQKLSKEYSISMGCRTMDIMHVAIALYFNCSSFFTNDERQKKLALALDMNVDSVF